MFRYKKECIVTVGIFIISLLAVILIKNIYFRDVKIGEPINNVRGFNNIKSNEIKYAIATTKKISTTTTILTNYQDFDSFNTEQEVIEYDSFYEVAPTVDDDGSIVFDGLTVTELTDKLNKSLNSYLSNTGYFFADYTRKTGLDPYLAVAIVLLETGCKWTCSTLTITCNNIGGLKGSPSCNGSAYSRYDTLEEGIDSYLEIIYNNYYLKGMDTAEKMASTYAASPTWSIKVNNYMDEIKNK